MTARGLKAPLCRALVIASLLACGVKGDPRPPRASPPRPRTLAGVHRAPASQPATAPAWTPGTEGEQ